MMTNTDDDFLKPAMPDILECKVTYFKLDNRDIFWELYMFVFVFDWLRMKTNTSFRFD